jgi:hypothetical protein
MTLSTRAVYTFIDEDSKFSVYKHYDGYPEGAHGFIKEAKKFAWDLPRFDASEFAAAFIKANKGEAGGDVYLTEGHNRHGDLSYRYEITRDKDKLIVKTFETVYPYKGNKQKFIEKSVDTL